MQSLEHKAPSLSFLNQENEDIPRVGGQAWPQPQTQLQPHTSAPSQNNNFLTRKTPGPKMAEKKRRTRAPVKRRYKVRVIAQPIPTTPTLTTPLNLIPTVPIPIVATSTATNQMLVVKSAAASIPVTVYNLAQGKFEGIPNPTGRPQAEENPSTPAAVQPNKGHNLKLDPVPQSSRLERMPLGLTPYQPP